MIIFGFNAFYSLETFIEKRINNNNRKSIIYPVTTEYIKLTASIISSMVLTLIIRLFNLTNYARKQELEMRMERNGINEAVRNFSQKILARRVIAIALISLFSFYYYTVFCSIYVNTQYGFIFSGIWCLLFNWFILSMLYILIISIVEFNESYATAYYIKRLFLF